MALADLRPALDPSHLAVARWPVGWRPDPLPDGFFGLVEDEDEVTLVCSEQALSRYDGPLAVEAGWRRVTFAGPLPWEQVGFLADVATRLAGALIPFTSMAGFTTDHVLVRAAQADLAVAVLSGEQPPPARPGTTNP
ncbi:MAG: ACT domain-containing protein [Mycobacteriales bacterium]